MKASTLISIFILNITMISGMLTTIPEGHVGVYKDKNQIQPDLVTHFTIYNPLWTSITLVKIILG